VTAASGKSDRPSQQRDASGSPRGGTLPRHLAVIMDGNGRWARSRGLPRLAGHEKGAESVRAVTTECARLGGITQLTLYALSYDNLHKRPKTEIRGLFRLLDRYLKGELPTIMKNNIRFKAIGETEEFPASLQKRIADTTAASASNTGMAMCLALNYSSRREIARAARALAGRVRDGRLDPERIDEAAIGAELYTADVGDVDLLIRTGGDWRVSDFLLWQISYAEIVVTDTFWPAFREPELHAALDDFAHRQRRFGAVGEA
jgi:undecaprenyl diphosphate synthase